jgi:hypothetical protein
MDNLTVYRGNNKTLTATLPATLTGTTGTSVLTVNTKESLSYSGTTLFSVTGVKNGADVKFSITSTQNNTSEYVYFYNITTTSGANKYTIAEGSYTILPSLT